MPGLAEVWAKFAQDSGGALPRAAAIAVAAPIEGDIAHLHELRLADRPATASPAELGLDRLTLLNDFGAVAHAVSVMAPDELSPLCGPGELPADGITTVLGPGTGLGVAILDRRGGGVARDRDRGRPYRLLPARSRGGGALRPSRPPATAAPRSSGSSPGPGLIDIYRFLGGGDWDPNKAGTLWDAAIDGGDPLAEKALAILVRCFGAAAGDIALAHGAMGVAITGGLANRIAHLLQSPDVRGPLHRQGPLPRPHASARRCGWSPMPSRACSARRSRSAGAAHRRHPSASGSRTKVAAVPQSRPPPG